MASGNTAFNLKSFSFLKSLEIKNNKSWFEKNRQIYQDHLINPIKSLINDLDLFVINEIDNNLETKPAINKSISRIYRDTRFAHNKLPFKNNIGFNFKKKSSDWKYHPSFFFRIFPYGYTFGMGVMKNSPEYFANFRKKIDFNPKIFEEIINPVLKNREFEILGENYKKYQFQLDQNNPNHQAIKPKSLININRFYRKKSILIRYFRDQNFYQNQQQLSIDITEKFQTLINLYKFIKSSF
jgi:uncharacterized protein (TIGR02453 family)